MWSPGMKHAHPVRSNRCVDLSCLSYSCFSRPPDSRTRRAIAPRRIRPSGGPCAAAHPLRRQSSAFRISGKIARLAERPPHRLSRSNFLDDFSCRCVTPEPISQSFRFSCIRTHSENYEICITLVSIFLFIIALSNSENCHHSMSH